MPEAPRQRPSDYTLLHSFSGHVKAKPQAVLEALCRRFDPGPGSRSLFTADPRSYLLIAQGGWWYRGEYRVIADDHGSHVEHAILNVAHRARPMSRWVGRKTTDAAPAEFETLMRQLRLELE